MRAKTIFSESIMFAATIALCVAAMPSFAATYYKVGTDTANTSSFAGNVSTSVGWSANESATKPDSTISDFENSDFIVRNSLVLRTPPTAAEAITFGGRSLTLTGSGNLTLKKESNGGTRTVTIPSLVVDGEGAVYMAQDESLFILDGSITLNASSTLTVNYSVNASPDWRYLTINAAVTGDATTAINIVGSGKDGGKRLVLNNMGAFFGTLAGVDSATQLSLVVNGAFGGTVTSLPATTKAVTFDYDGLPAATGLRVATTTIPAALKTKLTFYSATTDFAAGLKLLTFPAGTDVDSGEFTVKYVDAHSGETRQFELELVTNGDDTLSLVTKGGKTFYKIGVDPGNYSSFTTNYSASIGWSETSGATATDPFSALDMANATFVVGGSQVLRTPPNSSSDTFLGKTLRLEGNGTANNIMLKGANNCVVTIPHLVVQNGRFFAGDGNHAYTLKGKIDIVSGSALYMCGADTGTRTVYVNSDIAGDATTKITIPQANAGTQVFHLNSAADFLGEVTVTAATKSPTKLYINGPFGGSVGALGAKLAAFVVNYDGLPADKGLRCTASSIPAPLKTTLTLYSATADFGQHHLPLITFPAGTDVDPTQFTVKHATTRDGTAEAFPLLTTYTADDGSVVLAVDASYPATARLVSGVWRFYGTDGRDVTATCGLDAPTAATTVLIGSTDELAAVRAAGITPKGYRLTADFDVTGTTDVSDMVALGAEQGFAIDLKGNALALAGDFFSNASAGSLSLLVNGDFSADDLGGMTPVRALPSGHVPSGWTKNGTSGLNVSGYQSVVLVRNDASNAYKQRTDNQTWVKMSKNYWISQDFTLPCRSTVTLTYKVAAANGSKTASNTTDFSILFDGETVYSLTGQGTATTTRTFRYALDAGTHTIKFLCLSSTKANTLLTGISLTAQTIAGTFTDSVGGGDLHVDVATNTVVNNATVDLTGKLKLVKEGWGRLYSHRLGLSYNGGTEIVRGLLGSASAGNDTVDWLASKCTHGALGSRIVVRAEGTLDIVGNYEYGVYDIVLDGGTLRNCSVSDGAVMQSKTAWNGLGAFSLTADSTLYPRSDTVVNGWNEKPVDLGGHELYVELSVGAKQLYWSKDITNGTLRIGPCDYQMDSRLVIYGRDVDARTVDFIDEGGLVLNTAFSVRDYTAARAFSNKNTAGTTNLYVYGTFTPQTDYFWGCMMMDGSAIDLSGKDGTWSLTSAETNGLTNVVFETGATVAVKLGGRYVSAKVPVISWTEENRSKPENLDTLTFVSAEGERKRAFIKKEDGLYAQTGLVIIVK